MRYITTGGYTLAFIDEYYFTEYEFFFNYILMALLFIYALSAMVIAVCLWLFRYMNMTLSFAVPMVFLTTDLNTFSLIREETKMQP